MCLGEEALDLFVCHFTKNSSLFQPDIVVIGTQWVVAGPSLKSLLPTQTLTQRAAPGRLAERWPTGR